LNGIGPLGSGQNEHEEPPTSRLIFDQREVQKSRESVNEMNSCLNTSARQPDYSPVRIGRSCGNDPKVNLVGAANLR
jgi:hypothetical protein